MSPTISLSSFKVYVLHVEIIFRLKSFKLQLQVGSQFLCLLALIIHELQGQETKDIENQPRLKISRYSWFFSLNLHENRVQFPEERDAFILDHQHGSRVVTCKPAVRLRIYNLEMHFGKSTNLLRKLFPFQSSINVTLEESICQRVNCRVQN